MGNKIKNYVLSHNAGSFVKRFFVMLFATVLMNFGIACYYQCLLGTDPFSVFVDGEHYLMGLSYGGVTNINNIFFFVFMIIFTRRYLHVGSFVGLLCAGTLIDFFNELIATHFPATDLTTKIILLVVGLVTFAVAVGMQIVADLGIGGIDALNVWLADITKINLRWIRILEDLAFTVIGVILGLIAGVGVFDMIGVGTIVGVLGTGPIIKWFMNLTGKGFEKWFGPLRKTPAKAEG